MNVNLQQTEKLLKSTQSFSQLGFSLMLTRLRTSYVKNPTPAAVQSGMKEINEFLGKFSTIMTNDYAVISKM